MLKHNVKYSTLLAYLVFIGCGENNLKSITAQESSKKENFKAFFERFSSDMLFQKGRIDTPLAVIFSDTDGDTLQSMVIEKVSFNQEDWKGKLEISQAKISKDTFKVMVQVADTGVFIEHYFALRKGIWHLFEIRDLSD